MPGLKEFKERIKQDSAFADKVSRLRSLDEILDFASAGGYTLSEEEIEALTDVSEADLCRVYGGINSGGFEQVVLLTAAL